MMIATCRGTPKRALTAVGDASTSDMECLGGCPAPSHRQDFFFFGNECLIDLGDSLVRGLLNLFGVAIMDGLLLVSYFNAMRAHGLPLRQAIVEGASKRVRPVMMTALTALLGLLPAALSTRIGAQTQDVARFLDRLHAETREAEAERLRLRTREQELEKEKSRLATEGKKEQQAKVREMEKKLESLFKDFEYHARETVNAIQDRAVAQKLSKDAERRIAKLRREFREQFDSVVVAHSSGADQGDPNAHPTLVKHVSQGDTVKLKSVGRPATVTRRLDDNHFEVEVGAMKMKIARDDIAEVLVRAADSPVNAARAHGISVSLRREGGGVPSEINVIGRTVDEATSEV